MGGGGGGEFWGYWKVFWCVLYGQSEDTQGKVTRMVMVAGHSFDALQTG